MPDLIEAIAALPDYEVEYLDAAHELNHFAQCLRDLSENPTFRTAEATCLASQRVLYAMDELRWKAPAAQYKQHVSKAAKLLNSAAQYRDSALAAARPEKKGIVTIFFQNINTRHQELAERLNQI